MKKKLTKISILTDGIYPYVMGGMQKHSYYLAKYFASKKIKVELYHYLPPNKSIIQNIFTDSENENIEQIIIKMPSADKFPGHYIRQSKSYAKQIAKTFATRPPTDFVYAQGFTAWALLELKNKIVKIPPIGVNFHGLEPLQETADLKSKLHQYLLKPQILNNIHKANYVFSLGNKLTELLIKNAVSIQKIIQIPIGIETSWITDTIRLPEKKLNFVFVGRNERRKAIPEISKAIRNINPQKANFHFIGPITSSDLKLTATELNQHANIILHGSLSQQEQIKQIMMHCDVLICTSYSEGMPTVILEAMSCGLTVLATDVGAVNELVNNQTGWLIQSPNPQEIQRGIQEILDTDTTKLQDKKSNALQHIKLHYLWGEVIEKTISEIEILL